MLKYQKFLQPLKPLLLLCSLFSAFLIPSLLPTTTSAASSIAVSPPSAEIKLSPGETYSGTIDIVNPSSATEDLAFSAYVAPYSVSDQSYTADLSSMTSSTKIANWVSLKNPTGTVSPNSKAVLDYTITVPADAPAGGQYCAIIVQASDDSSSTIGESFEIASLIYAIIGGDNIESGRIVSIDTPSIFFFTPLTFSVTFENSGNVHKNARISLELRSFFTDELIFPDLDVESPSSISETIMPETSHTAIFTVKDVPALGLFKLKETVSYLDQTEVVEKVIFVCPPWFCIMVIVAIILIIAVITISIIHHRKTKNNKRKARK